MERLTEKCWRNLDPWECCGQDNFCKRGCHDKGGCINGCIVPKLYCKLAKYEEAEEQGLLLRLPCKVGDTIYRINIGAKEPIIKMRVLQVQWKQLHKDRVIIRIDAINDDDMGESCYLLEDIGKTVFLTKEEAEQALAEMRNIEEAKDNLATEIARIGYTDKAGARERIEQALKQIGE